MTQRRLRILVIDDSAPYLDFMCTLLGTEGHAALAARSLQEATAVLTAERLDLVITEALLPGLPPFAVLDRLQQHPQTRGVPVLLCTAAVMEVQAVRDWLKEKNVKVVFKPFDIDELTVLIVTVADQGHQPS